MNNSAMSRRHFLNAAAVVALSNSVLSDTSFANLLTQIFDWDFL